MNVKTTLLLLVVLLAVVAALLVTRGRQVVVPSQDTRPGSALFTSDQFPADSINHVSLQFADGPPIEVEKRDGQWWQLQPVRFPLNQWSLRQALESLADLRALESFQPGQNANPSLQDAGLAPPALTVHLRGSRGDQEIKHVIRLGRSISSRTYVQVGDRLPVYVVSGALADIFNRQAVLQWRRTTLPAPLAGSVQRALLETPQHTLELVKLDGRWRIEQPVSARADAQAADALAAAIARLTIKQFIADAPADLSVYGLKSPTAALTVFASAPAPVPSPATAPATPHATTDPAASQPATGPWAPPPLRQTLKVGAPADMQGDTYFATWTDSDDPGNVVFTIPQQDVARLQVSLDALRDSRITPMAASDVKEIRIDRPGAQSLTLHRTTEGWDFGMADLGYLPDTELANQLVAAVTAARAKSFQSQPPPQPPTAVITLQAITGSPSEVLRLWQVNSPQASQAAASAPDWLVVRQQEETVYVVPAEELLGVLQPALALRQRLILDIQPSQVAALTLAQPQGATYQLSRVPPATQPDTQPASPPSTPGSWVLAGDDRLDENALTSLLRAAFPLRAVRWLEGPPPHDPLVRLRLRVDDGRDYELVFEPASHRAAFGPPGSLGPPFEIPSALAQAAQVELRDTAVVSVGIEDIASVTITDPGQPSATIRRDAHGQYLSSAAGQLDTQAVDELFRALAALRVAHYLDKAPDPAPPSSRTIELVLVSGRSLRLLLPAAASTLGDDQPVQIDNRWVLLDPTTLATLTVPLSVPGNSLQK